jgi:hypothetical protein
MADTFVDFIARERDRLHAERDTIVNQQQELETKIIAINNELAAIAAYEAHKTGKATTPARGRMATTRRGSKREALLALLRHHPVTGLSRGEILGQLGLKTDKSGSMSVSNALTALLKTNQVVREGGRYKTISM